MHNNCKRKCKSLDPEEREECERRCRRRELGFWLCCRTIGLLFILVVITVLVVIFAVVLKSPTTVPITTTTTTMTSGVSTTPPVGCTTVLFNTFDTVNTATEYGTAISLSQDGLTCALGAPLHDSPANDAGLVTAFEYVSMTWNAKGSDQLGTSASDNLGSFVNMHRSGTWMCAGARTSGIGYVRVWEYVASAWVQRGADIIGGSSFAELTQCHIGNGGSTIVVGASGYTGVNANEGRVRVFDYVASAWLQRGANIDGDAVGSMFGRRVRISEDGNRIIFTATNAPQSRILTYDWNGVGWSQPTPALTTCPGAVYTEIDMSSTGNHIVIGNGSTGNACVYSWSGSMWVQHGNIVTPPGTIIITRDVALTESGLGMAVSHTTGESGAGTVTTYNLVGGTTWTQHWTNTISSDYGTSISLSDNGAYVGASFPSNDEGLIYECPFGTITA